MLMLWKTPVWADEVSSVRDAIPICIDDPAKITVLTQFMKANANNNSRYDKYRSFFESSTNEELLARLIYSETLAANCPEYTDLVMAEVAGVIKNRIAKRHGDIKSVVFELKQFASSLHAYKASKFRDFLCPKDFALWRKAVTLAATSSPNESDYSYNYFLFKHDPRWPKAPWSLVETDISKQSKANACIKTYLNPSWK